MTRQYIGARYVPKFADPMEHNPALPYEVLTIVTANGNSYTSKKPVPPNIAITNTAYWALTGNYNGQVESISEEVEELSEHLDQEINSINTQFNQLYKLTRALNGKRIVVYGDSISSATTSPPSLYQPSWVEVLKTLLPASTITNAAVPGWQFSGNNGVANLINNATTFPYDIIIILAGINDARHGVPLGTPALGNTDITTFNGALNTVADKLSHVPSIPVIFISPLKCEGNRADDYNPYSPILAYRACIYRACQRFGWSYIEGYNAPLLAPLTSTKKEKFQPDGLHINNTYSPIFANYIAAKMMFESYDSLALTRTRVAADFITGYANKIFSWVDITSFGEASIASSGTIIPTGGIQTLGTCPPALAPNQSVIITVPMEASQFHEVGVVRVSTSGPITFQGPQHASAVTIELYSRWAINQYFTTATNN